jgi:bacterioferritin-associated ferredoxin
MIVCICNNVSAAKIRAEAENGCCSLADLKTSLGVATNCGTCSEIAEKIIFETLHEHQKAPMYVRVGR